MLLRVNPAPNADIHFVLKALGYDYSPVICAANFPAAFISRETSSRPVGSFHPFPAPTQVAS